MTPPSPDTTPLLPLVAAGHRDSVRDCIERYSPLVWAIARGLSRNMGLVEDVVQEVFIDLWQSAARFDPSRGSETSFVATIARRRVIDRRRRIARRPELQEIEPLEESSAGPDPALDRVDVEDEAARALVAVEQLQPDQRRVLLMAVMGGLTHQQIASDTGLPLGTVKSHVRRGLEKVVKMLERPPDAE